MNGEDGGKKMTLLMPKSRRIRESPSDLSRTPALLAVPQLCHVFARANDDDLSLPLPDRPRSQPANRRVSEARLNVNRERLNLLA